MQKLPPFFCARRVGELSARKLFTIEIFFIFLQSESDIRILNMKEEYEVPQSGVVVLAPESGVLHTSGDIDNMEWGD